MSSSFSGLLLWLEDISCLVNTLPQDKGEKISVVLHSVWSFLVSTLQELLFAFMGSYLGSQELTFIPTSKSISQNSNLLSSSSLFYI